MESCGKCRVISLCLENVYGLWLDAYSHIAIALAAYCILCIIVFLVSVVFVWIMVPDSDITGTFGCIRPVVPMAYSPYPVL